MTRTENTILKTLYIYGCRITCSSNVLNPTCIIPALWYTVMAIKSICLRAKLSVQQYFVLIYFACHYPPHISHSLCFICCSCFLGVRYRSWPATIVPDYGTAMGWPATKVTDYSTVMDWPATIETDYGTVTGWLTTKVTDYGTVMGWPAITIDTV